MGHFVLKYLEKHRIIIILDSGYGNSVTDISHRVRRLFAGFPFVWGLFKGEIINYHFSILNTISSTSHMKKYV